MTTQKQSIEDQLRQLPDNAWKLEKQILGMDDQDLTEEFQHEQHSVYPEIPESDGPWTKPQLTPKSVSIADKRIAIENLIA
jgi:hypothetical protein